MSPQEFHNIEKIKEGMRTVKEWTAIVEDYLEDAGFEPMAYFIQETTDSIEVDFDEQEAVFYIIDDIRKTNYKELFVVDYKRPVNSKRHTAVFYWTDDK